MGWVHSLQSGELRELLTAALVRRSGSPSFRRVCDVPPGPKAVYDKQLYRLVSCTIKSTSQSRSRPARQTPRSVTYHNHASSG